MNATPWTPGNHFELLINGEEYYPRALQRIREAQSEIYLETFIMFDDPAGAPFQKALIEAARRGVTVHMTLDGYGSQPLNDTAFMQDMLDAGIHVRMFDPQPTLLGWRLNVFKRLHRKIIVIDNRIAFVGGINLSHDHLRDYGEKSKQDYAIEVRGPLVAQIRRIAQLEAARLDKMRGAREPLTVPGADQPPESVGDMDGMFVIRDNRRHRNDIERIYREAVSRARERIVIANAYFFPSLRLRRAMRQAARRGVDVTLILQGKPDMRWAQWISETLYNYLLRAGVKIYQYVERPLHAKVAVIDGEWSTVGSSNLDPLSLALNLECNVFIRDRSFNRLLGQELEQLRVRHCKPVLLERTPDRFLWRHLLTFFCYHLYRRFPRWAGWVPAHAYARESSAADSRR